MDKGMYTITTVCTELREGENPRANPGRGTEKRCGARGRVLALATAKHPQRTYKHWMWFGVVFLSMVQEVLIYNIYITNMGCHFLRIK
jgi:hypothetical protein